MKRILTLALAATLALALMLPGVAMAAGAAAGPADGPADDNEDRWWVLAGHGSDCAIQHKGEKCNCGFSDAAPDPFPIIEQMMGAITGNTNGNSSGNPVFTAGGYDNGVLTFYKAPTRAEAGQDITFSVSGYYDEDDDFTPTLTRNTNFNGIQNLYLTEEKAIAFKGGKALIAVDQASRTGLAEAGFTFDKETILLNEAVVNPGAN